VAERALLPREEILVLLAAAPERIAALTEGLTPGQLCTNPAHGEWSAVEVLAHLRSCADVWGGAIARILAEDRPAIRAMSPRTWIRRTDYPGLAFGPSLRAFISQRADLLATLEALPPDGWARTAMVTGGGKVLERNIHSYADSLAGHERPHIKQIEQIVSVLRMQGTGHG
jgi:hypothetical protein